MLKVEGLEYEVTGHGDAVLLIHGALVADALLPLTREPALADRYRLIRYRRRGHGGSDAVPAVFSIEQQAQDALALMTHLGVTRAHVVGHSGGGTIAIQLALDAPSLVHSLALLEPATIPPDLALAFSENARPVLEAHRAGDPRRALDLWMNMVSVGTDWRTTVARTVPGGPEQAEKDASTFFDVEFPAFRGWSLDRERARRIRQPVLYVFGSESGPIIETFKQYFLSLIPHIEEAMAPGVDHAMQMQDPKVVAALVANFLSRHPISA
jgi:pimeloyl-ACP methyl ester carboxylesterase